ncbi:hypothetical protein B0T20DRAFT_132148 [Sordaria brevicollis]|uniref:Extracellular membrane protein CFEM domain-containing protein n=1 Tax=Sordaria brevicollis TaxID=83679 RepID=A0AAE0PLI7_SORBR|nr:hypothetical protein B0T20DRAFT_132148 [Sordaria brevicollis]
MKAALVPLVAMFAVAAAQSTACAADYIVETCLGTQRSRFELCDREDYGCRCTEAASIIACFDNCPNDVRKSTAVGERDTWCALNKQFPSTTAKAPAQTWTDTAVTAPTATAGAGADSNKEESGSDPTETDKDESSSSSSAAPSSSPTDSAAGAVLVNAGGLLAAVAGVAAAML